MRYAFDNTSVAYINRVYSAGLGNVPLAEYGKHEIVLLGTLWVYADIKTDYSAELDTTLETYQLLDKCRSHLMSQEETLSEDSFRLHETYLEGIERMAYDLENQIWLASCVANALYGLEGAACNVFNGKASVRVMNDLKPDREKMGKRIEERLRQTSFFDDFFHSVKTTP
jgi:hypothetical protein